MDLNQKAAPDVQSEESRNYTTAEKHDPDQLITVENGATNVVVDIPPAEARRILRKVDYRLIPLLSFLYLVAFVDRSNSEYTLRSLGETTTSRG